jgi:SPX domain
LGLHYFTTHHGYREQKLIKELPSLVPGEEINSKQRARSESLEGKFNSQDCLSQQFRHQNHGDKTTEAIISSCAESGGENSSPNIDSKSQNEVINKSPGEVAFFKLLHSEFKKASHFFDKAQQEFVIREERVREGMEIMKRPNSIMVSDKWSLLARSLYRLYKDLLLLETFAIMTYCSFSKILKKHDKVTGYDTRIAFMANVVNKANFTNYPVVLQMISRCEVLYEEVSQRLLKEGKEGLYEDERLFINMIHRLNEQCMDSAEAEGVPERQEIRRPNIDTHSKTSTASDQPMLSSLKLLVEDMNEAKAAGQVSDDFSAHAASNDRKRLAVLEANSLTKRSKSD